MVRRPEAAAFTAAPGHPPYLLFGAGLFIVGWHG
jgi:hypothetical protein